MLKRLWARRVPINLIILVVISLIVSLIGLVTYFSYDLVSDTVYEQFRSQELQLVTSLAQQSQSTLNVLTADLTTLSLQPGIKSAAVREHADGLALMAEAGEKHDGVIRSIVRYSFQGNLRYAWPAEMNDLIIAGESLPFSLPETLVRRTEGGAEVPLEIELWQASRTDDPDGTFLLVAPVYTEIRRTEFVLFEIDMDLLFDQVMGFLELDERGQLWVIDSNNVVMFQATENVPLSALTDRIPFVTLLSYRSPTLETFNLGSEDRLAAIAPIQNRGKSFVVVLSRNTDFAQKSVQRDLQNIFMLAVGSILLVALVAAVFAGHMAREAQRRREDIQRRETARTLLEMSRALNSTLDLEDVLRSIMAELSNLVPYDSAAILLLDRSKLTIAAHRGVDSVDHSASELDLDKAHAANRVIRTGRPFLINNTLEDERWVSISPDSEIRSWMGVPLRVRDKTVGVLNINSHTVERFTAEEVELAEAFADQASVALQNAQLHEMEVKQIEHELTIASDIQISLLPSTPPEMPQLEIVAYSSPARQVSGDYYQYLPMANGRLGIAVGDVSGKGIPAAMLMAVITTAMRDEITHNPDPADLLVSLNQRLVERTRTTHVNSALLVGIFDPPTRHLEIANGGMVQPYVRNGSEWSFVPVGGFPLGISKGATYSAKTITLAPGTVLLIMSDGVVEAQDPAGELFGFERLEELLNNLPADVTAQQVVDKILEETREHLAGEEAQDDLTILVIRSLEVPQSAEAETEKPAVVEAEASETKTDTAAADSPVSKVDEPESKAADPPEGG